MTVKGKPADNIMYVTDDIELCRIITLKLRKGVRVYIDILGGACRNCF